MIGALIPPLAGLGVLATLVPQVMAGEVLVQSWPWIESLGLNIAFRLDGLGMLFSLLVLGIGALVVVYGYYYLGKNDPIGPFYAMLMTFMGAMMGVVLSENLILLVMFWELTSISSFLLIGYWKHLPAARQGARLALAITGGGGLLMLGGVILLGMIVGSYDLSVVLASNEKILNHSLYPIMLVLVLMGAFTKSAQFPFHFWLPNAMTAPTPVSAYLHSATMVKAGVFLLARLHPALSGSELWFILVTGAGLTTMVFSAYVALFKHDLKGLLAYSTISHLGLITALFGFSTKLATVAAVFHIFNHAAFKASLFMTAGIIDHEAGTRDARILSGLRHSMPFTFGLALLGAAAMGGAPFFNGFLSKEMFFEEAFRLMEHPFMTGVVWSWAIPAAVVVGGLCSVAYSIRFVHDVFFGPEAHDLPGHPHDPPIGMRAPVAILVGICVVVGVYPPLIQKFISVCAAPVVGSALPDYYLWWWHGFTPALYMTMVAVAAGIGFYMVWKKVHQFHLDQNIPEISGKALFEKFMDSSVLAARGLTQELDNGSLQRYMAFSFMAAIVAGSLGFIQFGVFEGDKAPTPAPLAAIIPWFLLVAASLMTIYYQRKRLTALVFISVVGLIVSLSFIYLSAPDLGLTQISVEVVTILLMLLTLYVLPQRTPNESTPERRTRDAIVAILGGGGIAFLAYSVFTRNFESIAGYYLEKSVPEGGGTNVVNVTLVDFRGFDTMGEISVLAIAAVGILIMLTGRRPDTPDYAKPREEQAFPAMLTATTRPLMALILLVAIYIFMRGHNLPGGGFIAGLVASVALTIQYVASGINWTNERLKVDFVRLCGIGVLIAVATGLGSWFFGYPFLTSSVYHLHLPAIGEIHLASAIPFDLGVFFVVVGCMLTIMKRVSEYQRCDEVKNSQTRQP